jgi:hypothetical protein
MPVDPFVSGPPNPPNDAKMEHKYSYTPCSDWQIDVDGFPCAHMDIRSDSSESDRERMLVQAGCLVRGVNSLTDLNFIDYCVYVDGDRKATRYLVYQCNKVDGKVCFVLLQIVILIPHPGPVLHPRF